MYWRFGIHAINNSYSRRWELHKFISLMIKHITVNYCSNINSHREIYIYCVVSSLPEAAASRYFYLYSFFLTAEWFLFHENLFPIYFPSCVALPHFLLILINRSFLVAYYIWDHLYPIPLHLFLIFYYISLLI